MKYALMFTVSAALLLAPLAYAHGTGESYELKTGSVFVDVGYDTPFVVGSDTLLDFSLTDLAGAPVSYSAIEISVESGSRVQWKKVIPKPEFGKPVTSLVPETSGHWVFRTVFRDDSRVVADAKFPVAISGRALPRAVIPVPFVFASVMVLLGAFLWFFFRRSPA